MEENRLINVHHTTDNNLRAEHRQPSLRRVKENDDQPPARGGVGVSVVWGGGEGGGLVGRGGGA